MNYIDENLKLDILMSFNRNARFNIDTHYFIGIIKLFNNSKSNQVKD